jgi:asparagine synthase (glutamine-hydrolysing)
MCGIVGVIRSKAGSDPDLRARVLKAARLLRHRGPDWSGVHVQPGAILAHERLAIVDPESGGQPLIDHTGQVALAANGEIYNHRALRAATADYPYKTGSDCESILPLWHKHGDALVEQLHGMFAFVLTDAATGDFLVARDHLGILPLYWGVDREGGLWFASELKALRETCERYEAFPPGHLWSSRTGGPVRWFSPAWLDPEVVPTRAPDLGRLREVLERAVVSHMMTDVPWGVLLSGGLDSSLVASIAARHAARRIEDDEKSPAWWPRLHTFAVGLEGSPDLIAARKVADQLGTAHHEYHFTVQEGIDALSDVIWHLETYDVTTIRASTPMYLMSRKIKALGIKMVLSGEGSDEIFAGYLYFHKAPNAGELHRETLRKLSSCTCSTTCGRTSQPARGASRRGCRSWIGRCWRRR